MEAGSALGVNSLMSVARLSLSALTQSRLKSSCCQTRSMARNAAKRHHGEPLSAGPKTACGLWAPTRVLSGRM